MNENYFQKPEVYTVGMIKKLAELGLVDDDTVLIIATESGDEYIKRAYTARLVDGRMGLCLSDEEVKDV